MDCQLCRKQNHSGFNQNCLECNVGLKICDDCDPICLKCQPECLRHPSSIHQSQPQSDQQQEQQQVTKEEQQQQIEKFNSQLKEVQQNIDWNMDIKDPNVKIVLTQLMFINPITNTQLSMILELHDSDYDQELYTETGINIGDIYVPKMYDSCCQMHNNSFLISGGFNGKSYTSQSSVLKVSKYQNDYYFKVEDKQNMNLERITHKLFNLQDGKIIAVGGKKNGYLTSCELYDIDKNEWKFTGSLNIARSQFNGFMFNKQLYVFGGFTDNEKVANSIEKYENGEWRLLGSSFNDEYIVRPICIKKDEQNVLIVGGSDGNDVTNRISNVTIDGDRLIEIQSNQHLDRNRVEGIGYYNQDSNSVNVIGGAYMEFIIRAETIAMEQNGLRKIYAAIGKEENQMRAYPHYLWLQILS